MSKRKTKTEKLLSMLQDDLEKTIGQWWENLDTSSTSKAAIQWQQQAPFFLGDNTFKLMAKAAMGILESQSDVQEYLKREGMIT